ncbi:minor capsid protein [Ruania suaedae]|uniref:minor capsid protein n=1 Tax=Ruania suaedae TaxID=2897774 RepID=UPI001E4948F1|nr:minor capsid protein [Ruania suaedae]UFU03437.1 minor capsid protein [Ruania suaedae]
MDDAEVTLAICELLGGVPGWHWSTTTPPPAGEVGIFYGAIPDEPDRAIGARVYGGSDPHVYSPRRRVQLLIRGARGDVDDADQIAGFAFLVLQGRSRTKGLSQIERTSFGPLGADANGREERSENYLVYVDNPGVGT